jgi:hypothetical protein
LNWFCFQINQWYKQVRAKIQLLISLIHLTFKRKSKNEIKNDGEFRVGSGPFLLFRLVTFLYDVSKWHKQLYTIKKNTWKWFLQIFLEEGRGTAHFVSSAHFVDNCDKVGRLWQHIFSYWYTLSHTIRRMKSTMMNVCEKVVYKQTDRQARAVRKVRVQSR